jgi:stage V sporulation protein R
MELINQHTKHIMEGCKERARAAGLSFGNETLEYLVTNRDLLELSPKMMIPTLYDYWVQDVEVLKEKGRYELYPDNPYETVINTRPAISFYNDNNPDWLNVMIFYHVLAHIDFFQNNLFFRHTWDYDFSGQALSDKRLIANLRSEHGRWVDYVIEFARGIDNLVGYHGELTRMGRAGRSRLSPRLDFYFDVFLQQHRKLSTAAYMKEVERYNACVHEDDRRSEDLFFAKVEREHPEFNALFTKSRIQKSASRPDLIRFMINNAPALKKDANQWMCSVLEVVRNTSLFFQPQIRTKIMNEGWASYWHETLFLNDDRITGHEIDFARVNAGVTSMPRVGLNPYALGMRLFYHIEEMADRGAYDFEFERILDAGRRQAYDRKTGQGREFIFRVRENFSDFTMINTFVDHEFVTRNKLFVAGRRLDSSRMVWQYYVRSRKTEDYRRMLFESLYHPPHITVNPEKSGEDGTLYLTHHFEGKSLVTEYILNTMLGIEFLWGAPVQLETSEVETGSPPAAGAAPLRAAVTFGEGLAPPEAVQWQRVVYTMKNRKLSRKVIG